MVYYRCTQEGSTPIIILIGGIARLLVIIVLRWLCNKLSGRIILMTSRYSVLLLTLLALFFLTACGGSGGGVPDLGGTEWRLAEMNGEVIPEDVEITIAFSEGQISGQSACNRYFAGYEQDGTKLTFDSAGSTQMYCEGLMDYEADYLLALSVVKSFEQSGDNLKLMDQDGNAVLVFSK